MVLAPANTPPPPPEKLADGEWRIDVCTKVKRIPIFDKQPAREMLDNLLAWR